MEWFTKAKVIVAAACFGCSVAWFAWSFWRARRNERQLQDEQRMRAGFKVLRRRGWLPEDVQ